MKKILEIIVLTVVFMLTCNSKSHAQGWQRVLPEVISNLTPIHALEVFPLSDGGCLATYNYFYDHNLSMQDTSRALYVIRFDKNGNKLWNDRPLHQYTPTILDSTGRKDYDTLFETSVYQAIQLPNNNIVLMHGGWDTLNYISFSSRKDKYFTLIDNYGNRIKRVHNAGDKIQYLKDRHYNEEIDMSDEQMYYNEDNNTIECIALRKITGDSVLFVKTVYDINLIKISVLQKVIYKPNAGLSYYTYIGEYFTSNQLGTYRSKKRNYYWYDNDDNNDATNHNNNLPRILKISNNGAMIYDTIISDSLIFRTLQPSTPVNYFINEPIVSSSVDIDENDKGELSFGVCVVVQYDTIAQGNPYDRKFKTKHIIYTIDSVGNFIHTHIIESLLDTFGIDNVYRNYYQFYFGELLLTKYINNDTVLIVKVNDHVVFPTNYIWESFFLNIKTGAVISQHFFKPVMDDNFIQSDARYGSLKKNSKDNKSMFVNLFYTKDSTHFFPGVAKINNNGYPFSNIITGKVFGDINDNCMKNTIEKGISQYTVDAVNNNYSSYGVTDKDGNYIIGLNNTGNFNVAIRTNLTHPLWSDVCNPVQNILVSNEKRYDTVDFAMHPSILCPFNTVNVSSNSRFRIGRPITYYVSYCNNGTVASPNTQITIKLDSLLQFNSATIPYSSLPNNTYRFNISTLDFLSCGNFTFVATPNISGTILGETLCAEAHIYPDTVCTAQNYTGAIITSSARCLGDSVKFQLQNIGVGNMPQQKRYIVIEDNVLRISHNYQLNAGQILTETVKADTGKTYRIVAEEPDNFPVELGDPFTTAAVENCQPVHSNFSTGFFTQYPNYDGEPYRAMSCNVITGSYDPNEKIASPVGYGVQHYIEANTQIDYQINFQNTGNDTAFKVVVVDTISPKLDINSIQLGVASHNYQFQRTDSNVVQFVFDSIYLVDSFRNEALSHGFIKFKIQQKTNNPDGTKIYNKADIYFDYNVPVVTNQTFHTVGRDFIQVNLISEVKNVKFNVKDVKIFPNPFRDKTQVIVESDPLKDAVLLLMNLEGSILKTIPSTGNTFDIYREDLASGMYIFKILQSKETIATGKLVVQ